MDPVISFACSAVMILQQQLSYLYVLWYGLGRPVISSEIGSWSVFVLLRWLFVFGIIMKRDGLKPTSSDAITTLGIIKLLLSYVF